MAKTKTERNKSNIGRAAQAEPIGKTIPEQEEQKALLGNNFLLVCIASVMIILGFFLISGSPSGIDKFNDSIFSSTRIVVGPMFSFLGYALMAIAIIVKPKALRKK